MVVLAFGIPTKTIAQSTFSRCVNQQMTPEHSIQMRTLKLHVMTLISQKNYEKSQHLLYHGRTSDIGFVPDEERPLDDIDRRVYRT